MIGKSYLDSKYILLFSYSKANEEILCHEEHSAAEQARKSSGELLQGWRRNKSAQTRICVIIG